MNRISQGLKAISGAIGFSNLPKEKRYITFYSEGKSYWPHLENLLHVTLEQTINLFVMSALLLMILVLWLSIRT